MKLMLVFARRLLSGLMLALALQPGAHAGLVTGNWDPQFGSFLPGLSWQVKAEVLVPNACSNQADGIYSTASGPCSNASLEDFNFVHVWVRLFDTGLADANDFFGYSPNSAVYAIHNYFVASNVRVVAGQIVGFDTNAAFPQTLSCYSPCTNDSHYFSAVASAEGNLFQFDFTTNGPELICKGCASSFAQRLDDVHNNIGPYNPNRPDVASSTADLSQFLVTYTSNSTDTPKFANADGAALGAVLDGGGNYRGQSTSINGQLPEPGTGLLALAALCALVARRRQG